MIEFLNFLKASPTVYHAADTISAKLKKEGFSELKETEKWNLKRGGKYFVRREETLIAAFILPKNKIEKATLLATHLDRPCLKLKPICEVSDQKVGQLLTESYGAPLLHTWMDRDLVIAGKQGTKTVYFDDHPVIIPSLALHLDREIGEKGVKIHKQDHLKAIFSLDPKKSPLKNEIFSDLFLVPKEEPSFLGSNKELIASYGLDNLTSSFAVLEAISSAAPLAKSLSMAFFWDHEEVGSVSTKGADSMFTSELLDRILESREDLYRVKANSLCISSDLVHGFHPNFADRYDPKNSAHLGKGVAIKFNALQRYASSRSAVSHIAKVAKKHSVQLQHFAARSNIPTGSTLGPMMAAMSGIPTVDLGIGGLAMHSIRETVSTEDMKSLCKLLKCVIDE